MQVAIVVTDAARAARAIASMREGYDGPIDLFVTSNDVLHVLEASVTVAERLHQIAASADAHLQALDAGDDDLVIFADGVVVMVDWKDALDEAIDQAQLDLGRAPLCALSSAPGAPARPDPDAPYARIEKPVTSLDVHGLFVPAEHREALAAEVMLSASDESFGDVARRYVSETDGAELVVMAPEIILVMTTP